MNMKQIIEGVKQRQNERMQKPLFRDHFDEDVYGEDAKIERMNQRIENANHTNIIFMDEYEETE